MSYMKFITGILTAVAPVLNARKLANNNNGHKVKEFLGFMNSNNKDYNDMEDFVGRFETW